MAISDNEVEDSAKRPKSISGDEGSITEKSVDELKKADAFVAQRNATAPPFGLRIGKAQPFGSVQ